MSSISDWSEWCEEWFEGHSNGKSLMIRCIGNREGQYALTIGNIYPMTDEQFLFEDFNEDEERYETLMFNVLNDKGVMCKYSYRYFEPFNLDDELTDIDLETIFMEQQNNSVEKSNTIKTAEQKPELEDCKCKYCDIKVAKFNPIRNNILLQNENYGSQSRIINTFRYEFYCKNCIITEQMYICNYCGKFGEKRIHEIRGKKYCNDCYNNMVKNSEVKVCSKCKKLYLLRELRSSQIREEVCYNCLNRRLSNSDKNFKSSIPLSFFITKNVGCNDRTFGIELEVNSKEITDVSCNKLRRELDREQVNGIKLSQLLFTKRDGSLDDNKGIEFNTTILNGEKGIEAITKIVTIMSKYFYVDSKCGLHAHFGALDFTEKDTKNAILFYTIFQDYFKYLVKENRIGGHYCNKLPETSRKSILEVKEIRQKTPYFSDRYRAVNFTSLAKYGTIELRIMEGTLDKDKIIGWIRLHLKILDYIKANPTMFENTTRNKAILKKVLGTYMDKLLELEELEKGNLDTLGKFINRIERL